MSSRDRLARWTLCRSSRRVTRRSGRGFGVVVSAPAAILAMLLLGDVPARGLDCNAPVIACNTPSAFSAAAFGNGPNKTGNCNQGALVLRCYPPELVSE